MTAQGPGTRLGIVIVFALRQQISSLRRRLSALVLFVVVTLPLDMPPARYKTVNSVAAASPDTALLAGGAAPALPLINNL